MILKKILTLGAIGALFTGCADSFQGEYSDPQKAEIVDDRWNETDARKSAEVLINSMLSKPWLRNFRTANPGKNPIVMVSPMENRTDEHIDTKALSESVRDELINSGMVRFVNAENRDKIAKEIEYQQQSGMVSQQAAKKKGKQISAGYMLNGTISSSVHTQGGLKTVTYQTLMQLTDFETSEIIWSQKYDIKKRFKRSGSGW